MQTRLHSQEDCDCASSIADAGIYSGSPAHYAVACQDHAALLRFVQGLPKPAAAETVRTESEAMAEEAKAEALSAVIDNRDVPGRETPLHVAVRLGDPVATQILLSAGADCSLQNGNGWSSLQEAISTKQDAIASIIVRSYQASGWAKWRRRLPRIAAAMNGMRDFYVEVSYSFESSVIPLIARIAPSDTYRIWKRGSNLRTDMTFSGFDGIKTRRSGKTLLFLGEGSDDGSLQAGSLCMLDHESREITDALEKANKDLSDAEVAQLLSIMAQTYLYRPGIDVAQAILVPQLSWTWQEKEELVHGWKAKVYEMQDVIISLKSRQVPGTMPIEEFFWAFPCLRGCDDSSGEEPLGLTKRNESEQDIVEALTSRAMLCNPEIKHTAEMQDTEKKEVGSSVVVSPTSTASVDDKQGQSAPSELTVQQESAPKSSSSEMEANISPAHINGNEQNINKKSRKCTNARSPAEWELEESSKNMNGWEYCSESGGKTSRDFRIKEREFRKALRPVLWLAPDFPLKTEELLPLLDILANKVKPIGRLREVLTTKLPRGTFPVKIAFPLIPTIRIVVTFSRFEEMCYNQDFEGQSSMKGLHGLQDNYTQSSWSSSWMPTSKPMHSNLQEGPTECYDPFAIPKDYKWIKPEVQEYDKVSSKN